VKENKRSVRIGSSAAHAPKVKQYDAYAYPPRVIDQCMTQTENVKNARQKE